MLGNKINISHFHIPNQYETMHLKTLSTGRSTSVWCSCVSLTQLCIQIVPFWVSDVCLFDWFIWHAFIVCPHAGNPSAIYYIHSSGHRMHSRYILFANTRICNQTIVLFIYDFWAARIQLFCCKWCSNDHFCIAFVK